MSQENGNTSSSNADNRQFDWGPPSSTGTDGAKEWLVYIIILVLLTGGVWILLDINGQKPAPPPPTSKETTTADSGKIQPGTLTHKEPAIPASKFFVQLGAFADEVSAREVFDQLHSEGFAPTLAEPDHQYEIYRIFVGPFASEAEAEQKAQQLNELEFHCFVIESP